MINITDKHNCCGCSACVQACLKKCIKFDEDKQGFRYPVVNKEECIDCGLCEKVCPIINSNELRKPLNVYAAINPNKNIRMASSSGGIFTMLAETILKEGGVVFGARFDENWEVKHDFTETIEGLKLFRGSKYVQSCIGETYKQALKFLKNGRKVLFSGTSCQIAGLKKYLRKEYDNLLTVDVVCHGVPSPLVWREYLQQLITHPKGVAGKNTVLLSLKEKSVITGISFRDKSTGWKKYGFVVRGSSASKAEQNSVLLSDNNIIFHETYDRNLFMQVFLKNLCLRPSCYNCSAKSGKSGSDLTIADFWGIANHHPEWDDDKGTSLVLINTIKGVEYFKGLDIKVEETTYEQAFAGNRSLEYSVSESKYVNSFWKTFYKKGVLGGRDVLNAMKPTYLQRLKSLIYRVLLKFYK